MKNTGCNKATLLAVDIGNTHITAGVFREGRLLKRAFTKTQCKSFKFFKRLISRFAVRNAVICSVVPKAGTRVKKELTVLLGGLKPHIIGKDIKVPLVNRYRHARQLGQDRLVAAYAASLIYGPPLVVVDFGTAISFDVVSREKEYCGGMIFPGLQLCLDALKEHTALLPAVSVSAPKECIARDTRNSMLSGVVYGIAAVTDGCIKKIKEKIGKNALVVATGGSAKCMRAYCREIQNIDTDLVIKGIQLVYQYRQRGGKK